MELILFILFVAVPIISRLTRNKNTSQRPNQPPNQRPPANQPQASGQMTTPQGQMQTNSDFRKRLEEARQRVLEAERTNQSGQPSGQARSANATTTATSKPARAPFVSINPATSDPATSQPTASHKQARLLEGYGDSLEESISAPRKTSQSHKVKVAQPRPSKKLDKTLLVSRKRHKRVRLNLDKPSLIQGIIWREVFNEPVSKRPHKTSGRITSPQQPRP